MGRGKPAGELEGNQKSLGVFSSRALLAAVNRFRAVVSGNYFAFLIIQFMLSQSV